MAWWNASWGYKKKVNLSNASSGYQIKLLIGSDTGEGSCDVDCNSHCNTDFSDLRFTNSAENAELDYWIESYTTDGVAVVWIETNGDTEFYMYYGNAAASTTSSGANTFQFFDDFPGNSLDSNKWDTTGVPGITIASSEMTINNRGAGQTDYIQIKTAYGKGYAMRTKCKDVSGSRGIGFGWDQYDVTNYFSLETGGSTTNCIYWSDGTDQHDNSNVYSTTYFLMDLERTSTNIISRINGVKDVDSTTNEPTGNIKITMGELYAKNDICKKTVDWVLVRMRPDTETTVSSFAAEEEVPAGGTNWTILFTTNSL